MSPGPQSDGPSPLLEGGGSIARGDEQRAVECALALRSVVTAMIRRFGPSRLSPEECDEVWSQSLISLAEYAKCNEIRNLRAVLRRIASRRAADWIRQKSSERRMFEQHAKAIAQCYFPNTEAPIDPTYNELRDIIDSLIAQLPERQRIATETWLRGLPDTNDMSFLCEAVSEITKTKMTRNAVKRALEVGRQRVRIALGQKGIQAPGAFGGET